MLLYITLVCIYFMENEEDMTFAEFCRLYLSCGRKMMLRVGRANDVELSLKLCCVQ